MTSTKPNKKVFMSKDTFDIQPVVYSFRVMGGGPEAGSVMTAIRPPFWLYHDHALGVIWSLFHSSKNYVGITQLHWCLRFLMDLKNAQGEYTDDVEICIRVIQDDLVEQYAKLGTAIENAAEQKNSRKSSKSTNFEPRERPIREKSEIITQATSEDKEMQDPIAVSEEAVPASNSTMQDPANDEGTDEEGENWPTETTESANNSAATEEPRPSRIREQSSRTNVQEEHCDRVKCKVQEGDEKTKKETVSVTYNEMISRGPAPCAEQYSIADFFTESGYFEISNEEKLKENKTDEDPRRTDLADLSTKEMVNFLNSSRTQHIEIIKKEIERLYGLERFMENFPMEGFDAFLSRDLAKRMEDLENQMVAKETDGAGRKN